MTPPLLPKERNATKIILNNKPEVQTYLSTLCSCTYLSFKFKISWQSALVTDTKKNLHQHAFKFQSVRSLETSSYINLKVHQIRYKVLQHVIFNWLLTVVSQQYTCSMVDIFVLCIYSCYDWIFIFQFYSVPCIFTVSSSFTSANQNPQWLLSPVQCTAVDH